MPALSDKKILLGLSGGIAAYKSAILARRLIEQGATVRVVMTAGAQAFVQPLTFQALTGNPVHLDLLDPGAEAAMGHIELARWADAIVIAPASANLLARLAHGMADDLLSTLCLASDAPIYLAPAMNRLMWQNPATVHNCSILAARGLVFFGPAEGAQACGETGAGRMLEPEAIRDQLIAALAAAPLDTPLDTASDSAAVHDMPADLSLSPPTVPGDPPAAGSVPASVQVLAGKRMLITAGPTREAIDPVRYISNHSSGKMGFALAEAARNAGATVTLVAGPVSLPSVEGIHRIDVVSATDMLDAVLNEIEHVDVFISVAAVSDYRLEQVMGQKIKKNSEQMTLSLVRNPDILMSVANLARRPFCVGFAAETEQVQAHALAKMHAKRLDMIAANHVAQPGNPVFGTDTNALDVYWPTARNAQDRNTDDQDAGDQGHAHIPAASKQFVAESLLGLIATRLREREKAA